ncbi:MAG TPA: sigma-70 family RNA polymerase sigma factor [Terracidiphilus sp.]|jgi:RNA polymerase sigma-70 factor (ECF subfamily)|nr:sigma-70 family RNA polymerase sigma factor [Terracidiphilus sp.]
MHGQKVPVNELAKACARTADAAEWHDLLHRCVPVAAMVASRVARMWLGGASASSVVDDIVQDVFLKLCEQERRILREFRPQGEDSFLALLRVVTMSVANDYFRKRRSEKRGGKVVTVAIEEDPVGSTVASSDAGTSMHKSVLFAEIDRMLLDAPDTVTERDRTIFWFYYLQGLTADEIADLPGSDLTSKGVESALRRVTTWLKKRMEPSRGKPEPASAGEPR